MIKPKLYLNASPQTVEEGSLVYARNMKLDNDGALTSDYGYEDISGLSGKNIVGHIVGLDDCIYFLEHDDTTNVDSIIEYNELTKEYRNINSSWKYSGGKIDGQVSTNISGEKILTIAEYFEDDSNIPLKHINLSYCDSNDNESIYTQAPEVPMANLKLNDTYAKTIPNGVYVFYIRYKIRDGVYTNWFLCSNPIFAGTSEKVNTIQGGVQYINTHKDSAKSFILGLSFVNESAKDNYSEFQLGFTITHDESTNARSWKHFPMSTRTIYFDYDEVKEENIDLLNLNTYDIYNVKNVTNFRNKLYVSNYKESELNPADVNDLVESIRLDVENVTNGDEIEYNSIKFNNTLLRYNFDKGYYDKLDSNGTLISNIRNTFLTNDIFNYNISSFAEVETKTKEDACSFKLRWDSGSSVDSDVMLIWQIKNNLIGEAVFGENYNPTFGNGEFSLTYTGFVNFNNTYLKTFDRFSNHPWRTLGLTIGYGSMRPEEVQAGATGSEDGVYMFNNFKNWQLSSESIKYQRYDQTYIAIGNYDNGRYWVTSNVGFDSSARRAIENNIKKEIKSKSFTIIDHIEISSGAKTYKVDYNDISANEAFAGRDSEGRAVGSIFGDVNSEDDIVAGVNRTDIINKITDYLQSNTIAINENGNPIVRIDDKDIAINNVTIVAKHFDFDVDSVDVNVDSEHYDRDYTIKLTTTTYNSLVLVSCKENLIEVIDNTSAYTQASTLMPYSLYQPYIHFVDDHGVITNGIKYPYTVGTQWLTPYDDSRFILKYNVNLEGADTKNYKSFFISLVNVGDIILEGFNYTKVGNINILHCIELDSMLYTIHNNISIIDNIRTEITNEAKYNSSSTTNPTLAFGNCGYISWVDDNEYYNTKLFIKITRNVENNCKSLIKCSPYIPLEDTTSPQFITDGNYQSYICIVRKPDFDLSTSCYVAGTDIYSIDRESLIKLDEFKSPIQFQDSVPRIIRSNYNLNYLSLREDIQDSIFTVGNSTPKIKQIGKVLQSMNLSSVYELKPMYKDFANKYFRPFTEYTKTKFDNTIRVSNVLSDETFNNSVFNFYPTDYYNIPTNRGIIVKLFSIGNNIYAHTKASLYKFDGTQTLVSNEQDITLKNSDPFDKGISQIFDSQYGYGGIDNKEAGCVTYNYYVFYDKASNHLFAYQGNGQLTLIDASIYKLLSTIKLGGCRTLHDAINNRVLIELYSDTKNITLSFNYKSKSIVSFHDLTLERTFDTENASYSYNNNSVSKLFSKYTINIASDTIIDYYDGLTNIYGNATKHVTIFANNDVNNKLTPFGVSVVLFPQSTIATLNSVSVLANVVEDFLDTYSTTIENLRIKQLKRKPINPIASLNIETDCCISNVVSRAIDDTERPNPMTDYKGMDYDRGLWTSNYIRDILNETNVYNYPNTNNRDINSDNNAVVYGRWFICHITFNKDKAIKLEDITIRTNN